MDGIYGANVQWEQWRNNSDALVAGPLNWVFVAEAPLVSIASAALGCSWAAYEFYVHLLLATG